MDTILFPIAIATHCPICGRTLFVTVDVLDWDDYCQGELAQDAFPYLPATEREMLISGICPACQEDVFEAEED